eukprot:9482443-Pyramimonas_sp.AAC.1
MHSGSKSCEQSTAVTSSSGSRRPRRPCGTRGSSGRGPTSSIWDGLDIDAEFRALGGRRGNGA